MSFDLFFDLLIPKSWSLSPCLAYHFTNLQQNDSSFFFKISCLPCAALSWGQPTWQGLGFSRLVHEETHPCASNFILSIFYFKTVQAGCINSVLAQTVPSVNDSIWEKKYFLGLISVLNLGLQIFLLWPRKPLSLPSSVNKTLMSISV